ncbi:MAG: uncharacterized protein K0R73_1446 [Candidatus Midichloriaceae bacterium]|jgi:ankyrin repeat protein|nr:uncharacterized protein [Candidatus Midichloriaceae bacterium]
MFGFEGLEEDEVRRRADILLWIRDDKVDEIEKIDAEDFNKPDFFPLHFATLLGKLEIVKMLLEKQVSANSKMKHDGSTPLHIAVRCVDFEIAKVLLESGAKIDVKNLAGDTPLDIATQEGNLKMIKLLIWGEVDIVDNENLTWFTTLESAIKANDLELVKVFLKKNPNVVHNKNESGQGPLHIAFKYSRFKIAGLLLRNGISINAQNADGCTPLHIAAKGGYLTQVKVLLKINADVNAQNSAGDTPLHIVIKFGNFDVAKLLIEKGANVNVKNSARDTPLDIAAKHSGEIAELLLKKVYNSEASSEKGKEILELEAEKLKAKQQQENWCISSQVVITTVLASAALIALATLYCAGYNAASIKNLSDFCKESVPSLGISGIGAGVSL